jgi:hypothetical protein
MTPSENCKFGTNLMQVHRFLLPTNLSVMPQKEEDTFFITTKFLSTFNQTRFLKFLPTKSGQYVQGSPIPHIVHPMKHANR